MQAHTQWYLGKDKDDDFLPTTKSNLKQIFQE